jgi:hypothetical protein
LSDETVRFPLELVGTRPIADLQALKPPPRNWTTQEPMTSPQIICAWKPLEPGGFLESDFPEESHES